LLTALLVIASSAAADLSIYWLDPRTRSGE
jgi:ABC-type dipeptide/oligopeptide/nickel transport system permease component